MIGFIFGCGGTDQISGGDGDDTYVFRLLEGNLGNDFVSSYSGDSIEIRSTSTAPVAASSVSLVQDGSSSTGIKITYGNSYTIVTSKYGKLVLSDKDGSSSTTYDLGSVTYSSTPITASSLSNVSSSSIEETEEDLYLLGIQPDDSG